MVLEILDMTDFWDYVVSVDERWAEQSRVHEHVPVPHTHKIPRKMYVMLVNHVN